MCTAAKSSLSSNSHVAGGTTIWPSIIRQTQSSDLLFGTLSDGQMNVESSTVQYTLWEQAKCYPGVGWVVQILQWVAADQMKRGRRDLLSIEIYSIAVSRVRLTPRLPCIAVFNWCVGIEILTQQLWRSVLTGKNISAHYFDVLLKAVFTATEVPGARSCRNQ
jgi:hypothetical protein